MISELATMPPPTPRLRDDDAAAARVAELGGD